MHAEIKDNATYVVIGGETFEMPLVQSAEEVSAKLYELVRTEGVFDHYHPETGMTTFVKLVPGMAVKIFPGTTFKLLIQTSQAQQAQQQRPGQIITPGTFSGRRRDGHQ